MEPNAGVAAADKATATQVLSGHILVAGAGVSGKACARFISSLGAQVTVADGSAEARETVAAELGVSTADPEVLIAGGVADYSLVVTSPGWRPDSPLLVAAQGAGIEVIGDVELAFRLDRAEVFGPQRTWLVVTGTNGKTTTTGMLASIMEQAAVRTGDTAAAVGNIGVSLFDALESPERISVLAAELSSFQLHWSSTLTPDVGALLNLADDHLDWHGSFSHYAASKAKALTGVVAVVGEDAAVAAECERLQQAGTLAPRVVRFSDTAPEAGDVGIVDATLVDRSTGQDLQLCSVAGIEPPGRAGTLDAAAAAAIARQAGATPEEIALGLAAYKVAGHRGEVVAKINGVAYIDNSKATNPHAMGAALGGLDNVVLIAGGQLKGADLVPELRAHAHQLKAVVAFGLDRELVAAAVAAAAADVPVVVVEGTEPAGTMDDVVKHAAQHAEAGDTVLLAPAGASLDMYTGMAQRGDLFAASARALA